MRVLIASSTMPIRGGVISYIQILSEKLRKIGHHVDVINILGGSTNKPRYLSPGKLKVIKLLLDNDLLFFLVFLATRLILNIKVIYKMLFYNIEVIHAQDINSVNALYQLCKRRKVKLVMTLHGHLFNAGTSTRRITTGSWLSNYLYNKEVEAYKKAHRIIVVSNYAFDFVKKHTSENKVTLIRNMVDTEVFYPIGRDQRNKIRAGFGYNDNEFILIYAGRLVKSKGVDYLLKGFRLLHNSYPAKLIIAGYGFEKDRLKKLAFESGISPYVNFTGEISKDELLNMYRISDAFIMASVSDEDNIEGTPMALLEAMACGLPVITTHAGGLSAVARNLENALVINERDEESIAKAVSLLIEDSKLYNTLVQNELRDIDENYSLNAVVKTLLHVYSKEVPE